MPGVTTAYQTGVHGSRPANGAGCVLYSCTTHSLVYRDDGTTWATFMTLGAAGAYAPGGTDVAIADGGTGQSTATLGFDALSPMTTAGDLIIGGASGTRTRLAAGATSGHVLTSNGSGAAPSWQAAGGGGSGAVLGAKMYSTGSDTIWATASSTSTADIDATNAALTVTIPASGAIVCSVDVDFLYGTANNGGYIVLRTGSTDLQAASCIAHNVVSGGIGALTAAAGHLSAHFYVTGLTPGSLTLKVGFRRIGSTTLNVYANDGAGTAGHLAGPFVMAVWAA